MLRGRPWPPLYRPPPQVPPPPPDWREYFCMYRDALPPPVPPPPPLALPPRRQLLPCACLHAPSAQQHPRSRSLDNVREEDEAMLLEYHRHEPVARQRKITHHHSGSGSNHVANKENVKRRSMENLLEHRPTRRKPVGGGGPVGGGLNGSVGGGAGRPRFLAVTSLEDVQAVRCAEFHPTGPYYAVGSNSKTLRICAYPKLTDLREEHTTVQPTVLSKRTRHHKGSIYCMAWTPVGDLMATGSNDKTVKLMRFNAETATLEGAETELTMHDGTVRDVCFLEDTSNKSSLLISGGAGDCKIYVTDCATGQPYQALSGHSGHVLTLYNWGGAMFVSGSQDRTIRFWDLRARGCINVVTPLTSPATRGSPVAAVCVEPSGRLLVSGHEDASCVLFDVRGGRTLQTFKPHTADVRSIRFSPSAYYLLTAGYDNRLVLTDLQGDLTTPLPSVVVAQHQDKVISGRWHPVDFSFLSTSADRTATLWALPPV
ncbi:WD repeat-containing protein 47 isoform X5 [Nilaparvata lugens]|uniref:WD repeat-containing protein 47 isoform X5 n=1 Tax=Nilaparvata lugens TaxID=108931 RepID=UPI00193CB905|nr:WD repeat-containing protein 47 isoform X5 [Nilaparvata lugens]